VAGSTTTYTYTINGGSNYTFGGWSVLGGTISSQSGNQVVVKWGNNTGSNEGSVTYSVSCGTNVRIGAKVVDITGEPVVCNTYSFQGGDEGGSVSFTYCDGRADILSLSAGQENLFCVIPNSWNVTGTATVTLFGEGC
jgi:hypothetical protein